MAHTTQLRKNILHIRFTGVVSRAEVVGWAKELTQIEEALPTIPHRFTDLSDLDDIPIGYDEINHFRRRRESIAQRNPIRSAVYAPSDLQFGLSRMYQMLSSSPDTEVEIFRDREEAMAWLKDVAAAEVVAV